MEKTAKFEIVIIRHGDTVGSTSEERDACDVCLTELGEMQAELLGERLSAGSFDAIFSSPLVRTVQTAAAAAKKQEGQSVIELVPEIAELGTTFGYNFCSVEYLRKYYDNLKLCPDDFCSNRAMGFSDTSDDDSAIRAKRCVEYFRERFTYGERIAVFTHGAFTDYFLRAALGCEKSFMFSMNNTAVSKLKYTSDGRLRLSFHNDTSHLRSIAHDMDFTI